MLLKKKKTRTFKKNKYIKKNIEKINQISNTSFFFFKITKILKLFKNKKCYIKTNICLKYISQNSKQKIFLIAKKATKYVLKSKIQK